MRPIFTRIQKKRQRISPEILDLLEDSEPSAKRVARWAALDPNRTASSSSFMSQYEGRTWRNPLDPSMRVWSFQRSQVPFWVDPEVEKEEEKMPLIMTEIEARRWDREDAVWFKAIVSPDKPGVGMATYVLKQIAEMGDKHKVPIFLTAKPFGNLPNKLNQSQLMSWYKRHGWRKYTEYGDSLVRFPQGDPRRK